MSRDSYRRVRQLTLDFLVERTGGPAWYTGRSMKVAHEGLWIRDSDFRLCLAAQPARSRSSA